MTKKCLTCKLEFNKKKNKYCSQKCYWDSLKQALRGSKNPHYKERIVKSCPTCQTQFTTLPSRAHKKKYCNRGCIRVSEERRKFLSINSQFRLWKGAMSPSWKGGKTSDLIRLRMSKKYALWRKSIFERDHYKCTFCGIHNDKLNVDHIMPFSVLLDNLLKTKPISLFDSALEYPPLWDTNNGRTLCHDCHKTTETYGKKLAHQKLRT